MPKQSATILPKPKPQKVKSPYRVVKNYSNGFDIKVSDKNLYRVMVGSIVKIYTWHNNQWDFDKDIPKRDLEIIAGIVKTKFNIKVKI